MTNSVKRADPKPATETNEQNRFETIRKAAAELGTCTFVPNHLHLAGLDRLIYRKPNVFIGT